MEARDAIVWVEENKKRILRKAETYASYTPYDTEDFLQDAYEAAIKASDIMKEKMSNPSFQPVQVINGMEVKAFDAIFKTIHRQIVFGVTPYPEEGRYEHRDDGCRLKKRHPTTR